MHLHYAHKLLTMQLPELLKRLTKEYGKIAHTSGTFFENEAQDPARRRLWLLEMKNGGLFMDWIHPFEIYYKGALAEKMDLVEIKTYSSSMDIVTENPTGIYAKVNLSGIFFADGAYAEIRIAKYIKDKDETKTMTIHF